MSPEDPNDYGPRTTYLSAEDLEGAESTEGLETIVENTPDCVTDLPSAVDVPYQSTKEIEFILEDDYTPEDMLKLGVWTSDPNLEAHIEEISPNERKLVIDAANVEKGKYNTKVWVEDDEDNHEEYNIETNVLGPGNNPPIVNAPSDIYTQEGTGTSFPFEVEDETKKEDLKYRIISDYYKAEFEMGEGNEVIAKVSIKEGEDKNKYGEEGLELLVSDNEKTTTNYITAHIENTPDCVFVDLPESMNTEYQGTAEATFKAEDDYNLEDLIASGNCSNPDVNVQVNKLDTGLYEIIADTSNLDNQEEATYDITLVLEDPVENISNEATVPLNVGAPPASFITFSVNTYAVAVHDDDDNRVIDGWTGNMNAGNWGVEIYWVPSTSVNETSDAIYMDVDWANKELVKDLTEYDSQQTINIELPEKDYHDGIYYAKFHNMSDEYHDYSMLLDPSQDSQRKVVVGEEEGLDGQLMNIGFGYGPANHEDSGDQPVDYRYEVANSTSKWKSPPEIWYHQNEDNTPTPEMDQAIRDQLGIWFPDSEIIVKDEYTSPLPNGVLLIKNYENPMVAVWPYDDSNYTAYGKVSLPYDQEYYDLGYISAGKEISTASKVTAEMANKNGISMGSNSIWGVFSDGEKMPLDEAMIDMIEHMEPGIAVKTEYNKDPYAYSDADVFLQEYAFKKGNKIFYVSPKRSDF
jgi:hypothetical protein